MRLTILAALLVFPASLSAQPSPCAVSPSGVLQFDPYKPSDIAIVRNYGATMLAQLPLESLLKLDPYVPTQAALLRQLGGAIPVWPYAAYPGYPPNLWPPPSPKGAPCEPVRETTAAGLTTLNDVLAVLEHAPAATAAPGVAPSARQRVSIEYDGRTWINAGAAVRFSETEFVRVGEREGSPIFRRAGGDDTVIYVRTTPGMVAPFKAAF